MKNKDLMYQCIDWGVSILVAIIPLMAKRYYISIGIVVLALLISIMLLLRKQKKMKKEIQLYDGLLKHPVPLNGIVKYASNKKNNKEKYKNNSILLRELSLILEISGELIVSKRNDLKFTWIFDGKNNSVEAVDSMYFRIGGDNSVDINDLSMEISDCVCSDDCSPGRNKCFLKEGKKCDSSKNMIYERVNCDTISNLFLLRLFFSSIIRKNQDFIAKLSYVWPQCYNSAVDYFLIDPNNFADSIERINFSLKIDGKIVKKTSTVQLYSIKDERIICEGIIEMNKYTNSFLKTFNVEDEKIYFIQIKN